MTIRKVPRPNALLGAPTTQRAPDMPGSRPLGSPTTQRGAVAPDMVNVVGGLPAGNNGALQPPARRGPIAASVVTVNKRVVRGR